MCKKGHDKINLDESPVLDETYQVLSPVKIGAFHLNAHLREVSYRDATLREVTVYKSKNRCKLWKVVEFSVDWIV